MDTAATQRRAPAEASARRHKHLTYLTQAGSLLPLLLHSVRSELLLERTAELKKTEWMRARERSARRK